MSLSSALTPATQSYFKILETVSKHFGHKKKKRPNFTPSDITNMFTSVNELLYSPDIESLKGWCLQEIGKYELAQFVYDQVLTSSPMHAPTLRRKGQLFKIIHKDKESSQLFIMATLLEPDNLHLQILMEAELQCIDSEANKENNSFHEEDLSQDQSKNEYQNQDQTEIWRIRIKSIDKPLSHAKSVKSVIFKNNLFEEQSPLKESKPISKRTSILKLRSNQDTLSKQTTLKPKNVESDFDVRKIKSIDGAMSKKSNKDISKQIVFSYITQNVQHQSSSVNLKRKSSFGISKFHLSKDLLK